MREFAFDEAMTDVWHLPPWAEYRGGGPTRCRSCDTEILWVVSTKSGKRAPLDRDGTSHFATCPQANEWRK